MPVLLYGIQLLLFNRSLRFPNNHFKFFNMKNKTIKVTNVDFARLSKLILNEKEYNSNSNNLGKLYQELVRAVKVDPEEIEPDVVTMNSIIKFTDLHDKKSKMIKLVYPREADIRQNCISILAPVGIALLGYKKGDIVEWEVPVGKRFFVIDEIIYQPEAHGEYTV